jgi:hypothetical protein
MGPTPKPSALRQRRNKVSTAATLPAAGTAEGRAVPPLPVRGGGETPWHPETVAYWKLIWASEMAGEYLEADVPGLVALMKLQDRFNYGGHELAAEIRLQRQCFGLTPIDRRRLQWETGKVEDAERRRPKAGNIPQPTTRNDPRKGLALVK